MNMAEQAEVLAGLIDAGAMTEEDAAALLCETYNLTPVGAMAVIRNWRLYAQGGTGSWVHRGRWGRH